MGVGRISGPYYHYDLMVKTVTIKENILRFALEGAKNEINMLSSRKNLDSETKLFCSLNVSCIETALKEADKVRDEGGELEDRIEAIKTFLNKRQSRTVGHNKVIMHMLFTDASKALNLMDSAERYKTEIERLRNDT